MQWPWIAATDGRTLHVEKAMGWVADVFSPERLRRLPGRSAMGHVRYSTAGSSTLRNAQPISASFSRGPIALGHNGNLVNAETLRKELEAMAADGGWIDTLLNDRERAIGGAFARPGVHWARCVLSGARVPFVEGAHRGSPFHEGSA